MEQPHRKGDSAATVLMEVESEQTRVLLVGKRIEARSFTAGTFDATVIPPGTRKVMVTSSFKEASHTLSVLPAAKGKTLDLVVGRQAAKTMGGKPSLHRYQVLGKEGDQNLVHIVAVPRADLEWLGSRMRSFNLSPSVILTYPLAIALLLRKLGYFVKDEPLAFAEIRANEVYFVIYRGEGVAVFRKIPLEMSPGLGWTDTGAWNRLFQEIFQTFLYFRQRFHGVEVTKIILSGEKPSDDILAHMRAVLGAQIEELRVSRDLPYTKDILMKYPSLVGLSLVPAKYPLSMVIPSVEEEHRRRSTLLLQWFTVGAGLLLFVVAASYVFLNIGHLEDTNAVLKQHEEELTSRAGGLREWTQQLPAFEGLYAMQQETKSGGQPYWSEFFTELQAVAPPGLRLQTLTITRKGRSWAGTLKGYAKSESYERAVKLVNVLDRRVRLSPYFQNPVTTKDKPAFATREENTVTLGFTINFEVSHYSPPAVQAVTTTTALAPAAGGGNP